MFVRNIRLLSACAVISLAASTAARAQWAVVDSPAIAQLVKQVQTMEQQLATARNQLESANRAIQAMTGDRGMAQLLSGTNRNYLPANWTQLTAALQGSGGYPGLSTGVRSAMTTNAILTPQQLATLSPSQQQEIQTTRQWNAMQQTVSQQALANVSNRFASIQSLVAAISTAHDQKAILDLQARISGELGMLQNEQTKLQVLYQVTQAQQAVLAQQGRERVIDGQGRFETRFQPVP
jgi:type IV secretion system protein VirB5